MPVGSILSVKSSGNDVWFFHSLGSLHTGRLGQQARSSELPVSAGPGSTSSSFEHHTNWPCRCPNYVNLSITIILTKKKQPIFKKNLFSKISLRKTTFFYWFVLIEIHIATINWISLHQTISFLCISSTFWVYTTAYYGTCEHVKLDLFLALWT